MRVLYVKYSTLRAAEYRIRTQIIEHAGACVVRKYPATPEARAHVEAMAANAGRIREQAAMLEVPPCAMTGGVFEMPYIEGVPLDRLLVESALHGDTECVLRIADEYKRLVQAQPQTETDPGGHPAFLGWFGESRGKTACLSLGQVDLIFENIIRTPSGSYVQIDYEWLCECPVPVNYVFHRAVRILFLHHEGVLGSVISSERMLERLGVDLRESEAFCAWDRKMDERIRGNAALLPVPPAYLRTKSASGSAFAATAKLYYDTGEGFSEAQCVQAGYCGSRLRFVLPEPLRVRRLRFDPCEGTCCAAHIEEAWVENGTGRSPIACSGSNAALCEGDMHTFLTQDPQVFFDVPQIPVHAVEITACVNVPAGDVLRRAQEAQAKMEKARAKRRNRLPFIRHVVRLFRTRGRR